MDKFIVFNGGVFNTRHIIAFVKGKRDATPQYCITMHVTGDIERQWFDNEYKRDEAFNQLLRDLSNE